MLDKNDQNHDPIKIRLIVPNTLAISLQDLAPRRPLGSIIYTLIKSRFASERPDKNPEQEVGEPLPPREAPRPIRISPPIGPWPTETIPIIDPITEIEVELYVDVMTWSWLLEKASLSGSLEETIGKILFDAVNKRSELGLVFEGSQRIAANYQGVRAIGTHQKN